MRSDCLSLLLVATLVVFGFACSSSGRSGTTPNWAGILVLFQGRLVRLRLGQAVPPRVVARRDWVGIQYGQQRRQRGSYGDGRCDRIGGNRLIGWRFGDGRSRRRGRRRRPVLTGRRFGNGRGRWPGRRRRLVLIRWSRYGAWRWRARIRRNGRFGQRGQPRVGRDLSVRRDLLAMAGLPSTAGLQGRRRARLPARLSPKETATVRFKLAG